MAEPVTIMKAGFFTAVITPPAGVNMSGYRLRRGTAAGVHDDLQVRCALLDDGHSALTLLSLDLIGLDYGHAAAIKRRIAEECGLQPERILLGCTHTHSGPDTLHTPASAVELERYCRELYGTVAGCVSETMDRLEPTTVSLAQCDVRDLAFNRRIILRDGSVRLNLERIDDSQIAERGPVDPAASLLLFARDGGISGAIANFTLHATVLDQDNLLFTRDWPGYLVDALEDALTGKPVVLFFNGAFGNINQIQTTGIWISTFEEAERIARTIARQLAGAMESQIPLPDAAVHSQHDWLTIPRRRARSPEEIEGEIVRVRARLAGMNIALIGTGAMARRFLTAVRKEIEDVRFVAAHSRQAERLEQFRKEYPQIECTTDLTALLGRKDIQAVYISAPVHTHAELGMVAAQAGKHILCEKPMALTAADCQAMVEAAEAGGVVLQIGYMMRFHPAHQLIKQRIDSGDLGTLRFVHLERTTFIDFLSADMPEHRKWFIKPEESGGGALMDIGSHLIDLLLYLVDDEIETCQLRIREEPRLGVETDALASFRFRGGLLATVFASWRIPLHDNILQAYGDKASLFARGTLGPYTDGTVDRFAEAGREQIPVSYRNHYVLQLEHFRDCIAEKRQPITSGRACLPTERTRELLYRSRS